jgi:fibronectin-binding autotransporter adhesin
VGKREYRCLVVAACLWAGWSVATRADSFTTNIISGVSTNANGDYILGNTGSFDYLQIDSGGSLVCTLAELGNATAASNNAALVTDPNSVWVATYGLYMGPGNSLVISNGGLLETGLASYIGDGPGVPSTVAVVTGTNSLWSNSGSLVIGWLCSGAQLSIENGARVVSSNFVWLGTDGVASNVLIVTGPNSTLADSGGFLMGAGGPDNQFTLSDGGQFTSVGADIDGTNNVVTITGSNTVWSNGGSLQVGQYTGLNRVTISDGAVVSNADCYIGNNSGDNANIVFVSGTGATWNTGWVYVGDRCSGNQLVISNSAVVNSTGIDVGFSGQSNQMIVTGTNTICNSSTINVGCGGGENCFANMNNQLWIENGARVAGTLYASVGTCGEGSQVAVTGAGSQWTGIGQLILGPMDMACQFTIANGAIVQAGQMLVGEIGSDGSNQVTILNGGTLIVTNSLGNAPLVLSQTASITLEAGTIIGNNILISNLCQITGCGTITGNIKNLGTLAVNCPGGTLTVSGIVTNYASMVASNGASFEFLSPVVNLGTINVIDGSAQFPGGLVNLGTYLTVSNVLPVVTLGVNGTNVIVSFAATNSLSYVLQYRNDLLAGGWAVLTNNVAGTNAIIQIIDPGAAVLSQRFYRVGIILP